MTPRQFAALSVAAVVSAVAAIAVYTSSVEWSTATQGGEALFASLPNQIDQDASSHLVRLVDRKGDELAAVIVGNARLDASGLGNSGTYVRRPRDAQTWLANTRIDAGIEFTDWVNPQLFEARKEDVESLTVNLPGEKPLEIERAEDKRGHTLVDMPDGMKLKYVN